mgnify:CR=1 FL=1
MDRICQNTQAIAEFLSQHSKVSWVNYAGLKDHKDFNLVEKFMNGKASGILNFGLKGGEKAGAEFQDALNLFTRLVELFLLLGLFWDSFFKFSIVKSSAI